MSSPPRFAVLTICTGNICRSPYTARLLRHLVTERLGADAAVTVSSAGTYALSGSRIDPPVRARLRALGLDDDGHVARQLTPEMVATADLVLGAERAHRAAAVTLAPAALRTAFTLREFARLVADDGVGRSDLPVDPVCRAREMVVAARSRRGLGAPAAESDDDIPDPYGGPDATHDLATSMITDATRSIVASLWP